MIFDIYMADAIKAGKYNWELSEDGTYYSLQNVVYCTCPREVYFDDKGGLYQSLMICVPSAYLNADGTVDASGKANGYTAKSAPIILKNNCQGWNSSRPTIEGDDCSITYKDYIDAGFIYVGCGARSRDLKEGKAPAPVVDLKAAVRFLRLNSASIPGDCNKMISVGGSGAGQMSSVLGATGNMEEYYPYLYEIGAAGIEKNGDSYISTIDDRVYGCMVFYPIADIENADMAHAWLRFDSGETSIRRFFPVELRGTLLEFSQFQLVLQNDLAEAYCAYFNSLALADENGNPLSFHANPETGKLNPRNGAYYDKTLQNLSDALNKYLAQLENGDAYVLENYGIKADGSEETVLPDWLVKNAGGTYSVTSISGFHHGTNLKRKKGITAFDAFDKTGENNAFGTEGERAVHYSPSVAAVLKVNYDRYSKLPGFDKEQVDEYIRDAFRPDIAKQTHLMNATHLLLERAAGARSMDVAPNWRIRVGTADQHTSFSVGYNLAMAALKNSGIKVDYSLVWNMIHGREIEGTSTGTFIDWVHKICGHTEKPV